LSTGIDKRIVLVTSIVKFLEGRKGGGGGRMIDGKIFSQFENFFIMKLYKYYKS